MFSDNTATCPRSGVRWICWCPQHLLSEALPVCQRWLLSSLAWQRHLTQGCRQLNGPSRSCGCSHRINNHGNYTTVNLNSKTNLSWVLDMSQSPHWTPTGLALSHQTWQKPCSVHCIIIFLLHPWTLRNRAVKQLAQGHIVHLKILSIPNVQCSDLPYPTPPIRKQSHGS